jgi:transposase
MKTISVDLRERILATYDADEGTREAVARRFRVSLGLVKKLLQQRRRLGDLRPQHHRSGCKPRIVASHQHQLRTLLAKKPDLTLKELRAATGLACTLPAIHYVLVRLGLTYKKDAPRLRTRPSRHPARAPGLAAAASRLRSGAAGLPRRIGRENQYDPPLWPGPTRGAGPRQPALRPLAYHHDVVFHPAGRFHRLHDH